METEHEYVTFRYSDVIFSYYFSDERMCTKMVRDHFLVYVFSGEYILEENGRTVAVKPGECVFVRRDNRVNMTKQPGAGEPFMGIFLTFKRNFLREVFQKCERKELPVDVRKLPSSVIKLPDTPDIKSLFVSMTPYFDSEIKPSEEIMKLRLLEGVYALLRIDRRFYPTLFDFTEPWKIDILEFMEENYMYDLSMEEIASFTGRSLATFKRDFARISELSPQKWLIRRRLEAAYDILKNEGKKVSEVYEEVGFKNLAHFYTAFKRQYGYSPRK